MDGLPPAATLRAEPPSQVGGGSSVVTGMALVLSIVPLCSYVRVQRLQRVAFASSVASTARTACLAAAITAEGRSRPAVLLPCLAVGAEPEDLLAALHPGVLRKVPLGCIAFMVPLCQKSSALRVLALCKGWVLLLGLCMFSAHGAASFYFADPLTRCLTPFVATGTIVPSNRLIALCHHTVGRAIVCFIVPLIGN